MCGGPYVGMLVVFNAQLCRQIDGVSIGSPLGPALANAFLCHYKLIG